MSKNKRRTDAQPPDRGHGSQPKSRRPSRPLSNKGIAEALRERLTTQDGALTSVEAAAAETLSRQDARRRSIEQAHARKRAEEEAKGQVSRSVALAPQDRELMINLTGALERCSVALEDLLAYLMPERQAVLEEASESEPEVAADEAGDEEADADADADAEDPEAAAG